MNTLRVESKRHTNEDGGIYYEVEFFVDDRRLTDLVCEFESSFAGELAGKYSNIFYGSYTEDFLLGKEGEYGDHQTKTELLGCTCGCRGCWPLAVLIYVKKNKVYWEEFEQPHRSWDYSQFGPFTFDLQQYLSAISEIPKNEAEQTGPANPRPFGTSGMSPADSASRAGDMPEASGDS